MSSRGPITYRQLLSRYDQIEVPMIQRDYAQGRNSESDVRDAFLSSLIEALRKPSTERSLPLNLDFIYGSVAGQDLDRFAPLDGQQRLTTLFLLHWYLAWRDDQWIVFADLFQRRDKARFSYSVRPSSSEFFNALVAYRPDRNPETVEKLSSLIADQAWYFRNWRLDPTIQAVLDMLDALHTRLANSNGLFERLIDPQEPAITFHLLHLENFGLSDDLYIKMNARGKPLTGFETFKARYEQVLAKQPDDGVRYALAGVQLPVSEYVARQMDTTWADLFWKLRGAKNDLYDDALMGIIQQIVLVTRRPEDSSAYLDDLTLLRGTGSPPSYSEFLQRGWLDDGFTKTLIALFDTWSAADGRLAPQLPDAEYFDEASFFEEAAAGKSSLVYHRLIQFMAYAGYIEQSHGDVNPQRFQAWMRLIRNLAVNTEYNRLDDFRRSAQGIVDVLPFADDVIVHVASVDRAARGFSDVQQAEEKLKAELLLADKRWTHLITRAEQHSYFRGQIGFLLDFSGAMDRREVSAPSEWDSHIHGQLQDAFLRYLTLAELMFVSDGLDDMGNYRWQRALLALGDYFLPSGRNHSFLVDATNAPASWKRLLRGTDSAIKARAILKQLWDQLTPDEDLSQQLDAIIGSSEIGESWRSAFVQCPEAFAYCELNAIRRHWTGTIYLLRLTQLNGAHAELFSYCLYQSIQAQIAPGTFERLVVGPYVSVRDTSSEPYIPIEIHSRYGLLTFWLDFDSGAFRIGTTVIDHTEVAQLSDLLTSLGFSSADGTYVVHLRDTEVFDHLRKLDSELSRELA